MGGIIGSIAGAVIGRSASKKAGKQQAEAGQESLALSREIFETTEENAAPFIEGGSLALEALLFELGLGDAPTIGGTSGFRVGDRTFEDREDAVKFQNTFRLPTPAPLAPEPFDVAGRVENRLNPDPRQQVVAPQAPGSIPQIEEFSEGGQTFGGFQESPGFKFAFQQGVNAVDASAAASGGLFSGSTLQDLTKFGQGFSSQQRGPFLDRLGSLVNVGQRGVGQVSSAGSTFAQLGTDAIEGIGNAKSAATIGKANATITGINNLETSFGSLFADFF